MAILRALSKFVRSLGEFLYRPTGVSYTSVPIWRPWRDF